MLSMTKPLAAAICALLCAGATAQPAPADPAAARPAATVRVQAQNAAIEKMLTLRPEQKPLWDAYAKARTEAAAVLHRPGMHRAPAADIQGQLEARAERAAQRAKYFKLLSIRRAELLAVLDAGQKLVLETYEEREHAARGPKMHRGPGCGMQGGPRHGHGMQGGPRPGCGMQGEPRPGCDMQGGPRPGCGMMPHAPGAR